MPKRGETKFPPAELERRLIRALRSAGGEVMRSVLRESVSTQLSAFAFDRLVRPLVDSGQVVEEKRWVTHRIYGELYGERRVTFYRLRSHTTK